MIFSAAAAAGVPLVFVGNWQGSAYGHDLFARWAAHAGVTLLNSIYDQSRLAKLRARAIGYVHGHSVGGTNPSLVEALLHHDRVQAFSCAFNRATFKGHGDYFADERELAERLELPASGAIADDAMAQ